MTRKRRTALIILLIVILLIGISIMAYPIVSTMYMERVQSKVHTQYTDQIAVQDTSLLDQIRESAHIYNQRLFTGEISIMTPEENGYYQEMTIPGVSAMGYIKIPRLHIELPIYHGVGNDSLSSGCGHMPQSSLPVGGENTHAVISAHTGMASSKMFTDLPLLEPGDWFQLEVMDETLTYEIQSDADLQTVLPNEVQAIRIRPGEDLCTLVTCVPFGVNSHRLLVTGHRIPTPAEVPVPDISMESVETAPPSIWIQEYWHTVRQCLIMIATMLFPLGCYIVIQKIHQK